MKVEVYYNLHKNLFSVKSRQGDDYGKVFKHTPREVIVSPTFAVRQSGRLRVLKENKKNVHAFVRGHIVLDQILPSGKSRLVKYDPYKYDSFVFSDTEEPIKFADLAILNCNNGKPTIEVYNGR